MELFSAGDASQLEVIKEWISDSDIYMLILGARYGTIEPKSGRSYTEIEYDYAVANGMPYFAAVLDDNAIARKRKEGLVTRDDDNFAEQLSAFRAKVLSKTSRLFDDPRDLKVTVMQSLHDIEKRPSLVGWIRPTEVPSLTPLLEQLTKLSSENAKLVAKAAGVKPEPAFDLSMLDKSIELTVEARYKGYSSYAGKPTKTTWRALFSMIAMKLLAPANDDLLSRTVGCYLGGYDPDKWDPDVRVRQSDWETIKAQFLKLDFVEINYMQTIAKTAALFWTLTPLGRKVGLSLKADT
jgi:hypothetical protein